MALNLGPLGNNAQGINANANNTAAKAKKGKKSGKKPKTKKSDTKAPVDSAKITDAKETPAAKETAAAKEVAEAEKSTLPAALQGAKEVPGMFTLYQKDDKAWFSIKPEQFNKPFFFSANVSKSVGERRLVGSEMGDSQLAEFRKVGDRVQLVALHTENFAEPGSPQAKFVEEDYSDSIISSAPITESKKGAEDTIIDARVLLFPDIPGYAARMQYAYDSKFALDVKNTSFTAVDNNQRQTSFGVQAHYVSSLATPGDLPSTTPIPNSALTEFRYNFLKLPETPMKPRLADDRIGHFVTDRKDYTGDVGDGRVRYVNRWRLEKADPNAELSKPVKPITYWVANDVPEKYRESVKEGILAWNEAFEEIGYKDAIVVKQQTKADKFDTLDAEHASVRWYTAADVGSAVGPSHVDPRSGEILDADIRMADVFGRGAQKFLIDNPPKEEMAAEHGHIHHHGGEVCHHQHHAAIEHQFATGLMEARGDSDANQKLADAYIKDVVMHEVGHTLGLRHNFKGSTVFTAEQLADPEFTKENGLASTVMDYLPYNLAGKGETQGEYVMSKIGPYDKLAIKYAYGDQDPNTESEGLNEIAKLTTTDPMLIYETDEAADASDPEVSRFDMSSDPLGFAQKQVDLGLEYWDRAQNRELPEGTNYIENTKAFSSGLNKLGSAMRLATRYIGGVHIRRDHAGTEHALHTPVPAEKQADAVKLITETMFSPDSFQFKPEFVARMGKNRFDTWGDQNIHVGQSVLKTQVRALVGMLSPSIAQRLADNHEKLPAGEKSYELGDMYQTVQNSIWSELSEGKEVSQPRRDLQREYVRVLTPVLNGKANVTGEARSLLRYLSTELKKDVDARLEGDLPLVQRAHLDDVSQNLDRALNPEG